MGTLITAASITLLVTFVGVMVTFGAFFFSFSNTDFSIRVNNLQGTAMPGGSNSTAITIEGDSLPVVKPYAGGYVMLSASPDNKSMESFVALSLTDSDDNPPVQFTTQSLSSESNATWSIPDNDYCTII